MLMKYSVLGFLYRFGNVTEMVQKKNRPDFSGRAA